MDALQATLEDLNQFRKSMNLYLNSIRMLRGGMLALCSFLLWAWISPESWLQQLIVFALSLVLFFLMSHSQGLSLINRDTFLMSLDMKHPKMRVSAFDWAEQKGQSEDWQALIAEEVLRHKKEAKQLLLIKGSSLCLPLLLLIGLSQTAGQAWDSALSSLERVALSFSYGSRLRVVEGMDGEDQGLIKLSRDTQQLKVLEQNLIEVLVTAPPDSSPSLQLKDAEGKSIQTFRLVKSPSAEGQERIGRFSVTFALPSSASLFLSSVSDSKATAQISVQKLPVPQLSLSSPYEGEEPWPDDKPLPLTIEVKAEHPLQNLYLVIKAGEREIRELVSEVLAQDKTELKTQYNLLLESYMEKDLQDIEIYAEALDRAPGGGLTGRSKTLIVQAASAYGRYQQTLQTLREIKGKVDLGLNSLKDIQAQDLKPLSQKVGKQAEDSPYFDGLDRHQIRLFQQQLAAIEKKPDLGNLSQLSEDLNRFLFEHESLDDRERDRDFFIAARTLSRLLEQKADERKVSVPKIKDRILSYLEERHRRWQVRVQHLVPKLIPAEWEKIQKKPFHDSIEQIVAFDQKAKPQTAEALQRLSQTVESYRQWIEALEKAEDSSRSEQEQQRQQGLANAQNQLKDLQKRQSSISSKLDKAASKEQKILDDQWGALRMDQNSNIKGTKELEAQLRSLSPTAGERIRAAGEAMELTISSGNEAKFADAETASDFAGRLLQQAESAARNAQGDKGNRGRRRRVTSDQYFGNQVAGGDVDLRRDYQVNRKYREDVLDDVRELKKKESPESNDELLEDYLRRVIR